MAKTPMKLATVAIVALAIGSGLPAVADTTTTADTCLAQDNVWVHVEFDETVTGGCATEFGTAQEATISAGMTEEEGPFFTTIADRAADGTTAQEWWSLWTSDDGDDWAMAEVGAGELTLDAGQIVSWALQPDWDVDAVAPQANPLTGDEGAGETDDVDSDDDTNPGPPGAGV
ncbi:MAG: DUF4430 domain-containing protein [Propionibacterium sp.]|nr:DUF4430 domain-containing protein [Propionibacterium sp.]